MDHFDFCIAGAGVIGLATAFKLSETYPKATILIVDKAAHIGSETSSRNSEVIHAGIYYPTDSLKSKLCVAGRHQLYEFCQNYKVPFKKVGKLITATDNDDALKLENIKRQASNNDVTLELLDAQQSKRLEPNVKAVAALFSKETGIIDCHTYMTTLLALAEQNGVTLSLNTEVTDIAPSQNNDVGYKVSVQSLNTPYHFQCSNFINTCGLWASDIVNLTSDVKATPTYYCCGHYFNYMGRSPFQHLVYPIPSEQLQGLGIHATIDLAGQCRFGPDAEYIAAINYQFDESKKKDFIAAISNYFPSLDPKRLTPGYVGIRPKLSSKGQVAEDFKILGAENHSFQGLVHCLGIESPGLTSSLAIADYILAKPLNI